MIFTALNRWFAIRVDWFITALVTVGAVIVVIERGLSSSAYSGLALVYIMQVYQNLSPYLLSIALLYAYNGIVS